MSLLFKNHLLTPYGIYLCVLNLYYVRFVSSYFVDPSRIHPKNNNTIIVHVLFAFNI